MVEKFKDHNGKWGIPYETKNGQKRCYFAKYSDCKDTANPADIVCNAMGATLRWMNRDASPMRAMSVLQANAGTGSLTVSLTNIPDEYRITGSGEATERDSTIAVLVVEPGKEPYVKEIDSGLESLQHEVGGCIEAIYPYEDPVALVCNEEGKLEGLPLNRALRDEDGDIYSFLKLRNAAAAISEGGCVLRGSLH